MEYGKAVSTSVAIKGYQCNDTIQLTRSVRDCDNDTFRTYSTTLWISPDTGLRRIANPIEIAKTDFNANSHSSRVTVSSTSGADGKCTIDVFRDGALHMRVNTSEIHERIIGDEWFGGYSFSLDEDYLVYVAVPKKDKQTTFFDSSAGSSDALPSKYRCDEDWGEKFTGVSTLGLFVLNTINGSVQRVQGVDPDDTVGQPVFTPDGRGIVYTAWSALPVKLGMIYCYQRRCALKLAPFPLPASPDSSPAADACGQIPSPPPVHIVITPHLRLARSPQFSPVAEGSTSFLVFVGSRAGMDTHNASMELFCVNWDAFSAQSSPVAQVLSGAASLNVSLSSIQTFCEANCRVLIDDGCNSAVKLAGYSFPGLFCGGVRARSFVGQDLFVLETQWRSCSALLVVNLHNGSMHLLHFHNGSYLLSCDFNTSFEETSVFEVETDSRPVDCSGSWLGPCPFSSSLVDALPDGYVILLTSNPSTAPLLAVVRSTDICRAVKQTSQEQRRFVEVRAILSPPFPPMAINCTNAQPPEQPQLEVRTVEVCSYILYTACPPVDSTDGKVSLESANIIESILLVPEKGPNLKTPPPLIVSPHGGPHSAFTTTYMPHYADYLCRAAGMAVLLINYRGSTGFGTAALNDLPGRIGRLDVDDVMAATTGLAALSPALVDSGRVGIMGGSHGGFLTAHLLGQFPSYFKAGALRNPVITIPSMFTSSDIPDWTVVEACGIGAYDFNSFVPPSADAISQMYAVSPIRYVREVTAPVLLCLGAKDRRVPFSQGMEFYHALKAQRGGSVGTAVSSNAEVVLRVYPECDHAIDKPNGEADQFICIKNFFAKHLTVTE